MTSKQISLLCLFALLLTAGCKDDDFKGIIFDPVQLHATDFANGLNSPIGMSVDDSGRLWVTEAGTGNSDGSVSVITKNGTVHQVITGFSSFTSAESPGAEGLSHLLYKEGKLYILHGFSGMLYIADVAAYKPGDPVMQASTLPSEDIGTYVRSLNLTDPINSNIYNLTFGPGGHLYIVDAGANAIIKRDRNSKVLSLFARIPNVSPTTDAVPTGIVYDGKKFLVSTLTGFPFASGAAKIFRVSQEGNVSEFKSGFTTLTDIVLTPKNNPLVTQFADFSLTTTPPGFNPVSGRVANEAGAYLIEGLNMPTDIERSGTTTYYVLSYGLGKVQKLTY
ncbi:ScyD/ScyE family protein [Pontibacter sp. SGAir0037]|uniref:ScyD/ScyE family protein n=1 Tax=Pontibacter sp. SGAir0037 TaxID=2571030 RepID=UPI0010CD6AB0|nr:ScyD/ScyE family protein [Pontibacter sp. SGAir0037]QCR22450.1 ScyD/ScyE family protein [Pontibacter sp. SGAir0037]